MDNNIWKNKNINDLNSKTNFQGISIGYDEVYKIGQRQILPDYYPAIFDKPKHPDFTLNTFKVLLSVLDKVGYRFITFEELVRNNSEYEKQPVLVLRHDVDRLTKNTLKMAEIENDMGIKGTYYFRSVPQSYNEKIIKQLNSLGHEIGYHYETMDQIKYGGFRFSSKPKEEMIDEAYDLFCKELEKFRKVVPVTTICMHGSPKSKWDNKIIWEKYDYKSLGIVGEPYLDIDWNQTGYLTDTGRRWNGNNVSIRDKVNSKFKFDFNSTDDIIKNINSIPDKMMINFHPQRWNESYIPWAKEFFMQNIKNSVKWLKLKINHRLTPQYSSK